MRGYFGIGVEGLTKATNAGNLFRSAHAFGASFVFTIDSDYERSLAKSDTSRTEDNLPFYRFATVAAVTLPEECKLVGVELRDDAVDLPSFHHPRCVAYVLGRERGSLSDELLARCDHVVRIPTHFCINLAIAGAVVMYDRLLSRGKFAERPVGPLSDPVAKPDHAYGDPVFRAKPARHQP